MKLTDTGDVVILTCDGDVCPISKQANTKHNSNSKRTAPKHHLLTRISTCFALNCGVNQLSSEPTHQETLAADSASNKIVLEKLQEYLVN